MGDERKREQRILRGAAEVTTIVIIKNILEFQYLRSQGVSRISLFLSFSTVTFAMWIDISIYNHLETFEELRHGFSKHPYF